MLLYTYCLFSCFYGFCYIYTKFQINDLINKLNCKCLRSFLSFIKMRFVKQEVYCRGRVIYLQWIMLINNYTYNWILQLSKLLIWSNSSWKSFCKAHNTYVNIVTVDKQCPADLLSYHVQTTYLRTFITIKQISCNANVRHYYNRVIYPILFYIFECIFFGKVSSSRLINLAGK